jgi:hypothetical protein
MSAEAAPAINPCGVVTVPLAIKSIFSIIDKYITVGTDEAKKVYLYQSLNYCSYGFDNFPVYLIKNQI